MQNAEIKYDHKLYVCLYPYRQRLIYETVSFKICYLTLLRQSHCFSQKKPISSSTSFDNIHNV
jgi:hypothetical protein